MSGISATFVLGAIGTPAPYADMFSLAVVGAIVTGALWALAYLVVLVFTRNRNVEAASAGLEMGGPHAPAVAAYVTSGSGSTSLVLPTEAVSATLIDLVARKHFSFRDDGRGGIEVAPGAKQVELEPFEQMVDGLVRRSMRGDTVPTNALTTGDQNWFVSFTKSVGESARRAGLARKRASSSLFVGLLAASAIPGFCLGVALAIIYRDEMAGRYLRRDNQDGLIWVVMMIVLFVAGVLLTRIEGDRRTKAGDEAASRWLGLRGNLATDEAFAEIAPTGVAVWDRYLSYATAFGLCNEVMRRLPLGPENPKEVWSRATGTWRQVRIRRLAAYSSKPSSSVILIGLWILGFPLLVGGVTFAVAHDYYQRDPDGFASLHAGIRYGGVALFALLGIVGIFGLRMIVVGVLSFGRSRWIEGEVLRQRGQFLYVDDGTSDAIRPFIVAWTGPAPSDKEGRRVRIKAAPITQHVRAMEVVA